MLLTLLALITCVRSRGEEEEKRDGLAQAKDETIQLDLDNCLLNEEHIKYAYELAAYTNCTSLPYVYILSCSDCKDLSPLSELTELRTSYKLMGGSRVSLRISSSDIVDFSHLSKLTGTLHGGIFVNDNEKLTSLNGLENVKKVKEKGHSLVIGANPNLESIAGLSGLSGEISGTLYIADNPKLKNLQGLEGVSNFGSVKVEKEGTAMDISCFDFSCLQEKLFQKPRHSEL